MGLGPWLALLSLLPMPLATGSEPLSARIALQAPSPGGIAYSDPLVFDLRDPENLLARGLRISLDGQPLAFRPKQPGLPQQWLAEAQGLKSGQHRLGLSLGSESQELSFAYATVPVLARVSTLADATVKRFAPESLGWDWGEGLLLYALARLDQRLQERGNAPRYRDYLQRYYQHHLAVGLPVIDWSDKCAPGLAALELWRSTGEPVYRDIGERIVTYLKQAPRLQGGGLNHFGSWWASWVYPQSLWVDSLMMYDILAANWGTAFGDRELTAFAATQPLIFAERLQQTDGPLATRGLWKHAWYENSGEKVPTEPIYWLRGNGWALASLTEVSEQLQGKMDAATQARLREVYRHTAEALVYWQDRTGLWHGLINRPGELYLESSGSALIAYGLLRGLNQGWLPESYRPAATRALFGVLDRLENHADGLSLPGISDSTMPSESLGYAFVRQRNDKPYGLAALILAGIAYDRSQQPASPSKASK